MRPQYIIQNMSNNHAKVRSGVPRREQFFCPECGEFLLPVDIETFGCCPYCDRKLSCDDFFEEYVLLPVINRWVARTSKQFPRHG